MENKVETPIYLVTADVYLRFPEIMEEEYRDLLEYLDDEHILYERCTGEVNDLQNKVQQLEEKEELHLNRIDELVDRVVKLETNIAKAYKLLDEIDEYMLVEQHLKLVEAKKLLERGNENDWWRFDKKTS